MLGLLIVGEDYDSQLAALVKKNDALEDSMHKEHEANGSTPKFYSIRVQTMKNSIAICKLHAEESKKDLAVAKKKKAAKNVIWKLEGQIEHHEKRMKTLADDMKHWEEKAKEKPAKKSESVVNEATEIKTLAIQMKVSDTFFASMQDASGKTVYDYEGYVPDFFPDEHYGDYLYLDIDIKTGKITNWKVPTPKDLESMKGENRNKDAQEEPEAPAASSSPAAVDHKAIEAWLEKAKLAVEQKSKAEYPKTDINWSTLSWKKGPKYYKVMIDSVVGGRKSSYCFIDFQGNVYKSSGQAPAKGIRANITKKDPSTVEAETGWLYR